MTQPTQRRRYLSSEEYRAKVQAEAAVDAYAVQKAFPDAVVRMDGEEIDGRDIRFVISRSSVDRSGDVVHADGWNTSNYERNPVVLFGHDYRQLPIARAVTLEQKNDQLVSVARFADERENPFADQVFRLVKGGFLNAASVGFRPTKYRLSGEREGMEFLEQELLEWSVVPIPANPDALVSARDAGYAVSGVLAWAEDVVNKLDPRVVYNRIPVKGSWEWVKEVLQAQSLDYLNSKGLETGLGISTYICGIFRDFAYVCAIGWMRDWAQDTCYKIPFQVRGDKMAWKGTPETIELSVEVMAKSVNLSGGRAQDPPAGVTPIEAKEDLFRQFYGTPQEEKDGVSHRGDEEEIPTVVSPAMHARGDTTTTTTDQIVTTLTSNDGTTTTMTGALKDVMDRIEEKTDSLLDKTEELAIHVDALQDRVTPAGTDTTEKDAHPTVDISEKKENDTPAEQGVAEILEDLTGDHVFTLMLDDDDDVLILDDTDPDHLALRDELAKHANDTLHAQLT